MNLIPRNQLTDLDSMFDDFFTGFPMLVSRSGLTEGLSGMRVDIHETDRQYEIVADLPGVKKDDISVTLENNVLTVSASKQTESEEKKRGKLIRRERSSGSISRSFSVSPAIREEDIQASFKDGVLSITVPKRAETDNDRSARKIAIG